MLNDPVTQTLKRLLNTQRISLADYLHEARPWTNSQDKCKIDVIDQIAAEHQHYVPRLADALGIAGGTIVGSCFPMRFTSLNDLSLEYLLSKLIEAQQEAIAEIESCVSELRGQPMYFSLAREVLGCAKGHLENLLETSGQSNGGTGEHSVAA